MISKLFLSYILLNNIQNSYSQICTLEYNIDYEGSDLRNVTGSIEDCCSLCDKTEGCQVYTWSAFLDGTCWLKTGITNRVPKIGTLSSVLVLPSKSLPKTDSGSVGVSEIIDLLTSSSGSKAVEEILNPNNGSNNEPSDGSGFVITSGSDENGIGDNETVNIDKPIIIKPVANSTVSPILGSNDQTDSDNIIGATGSSGNTGNTNNSGSKNNDNKPTSNAYKNINNIYSLSILLVLAFLQ